MALKRDKEFAINGRQKGSVRKETNAVSGTTVMSVQKQQQKPLHLQIQQHKEEEVRREKGSSEVGVDLGSPTDRPCKDFLNGICTKLPCDNLHPPESQNRVVHSAISARFRTGRLRNNQIKSRKRVVTKMQWPFLKDVRQLGCVFQDTAPLASWSILRKAQKSWDQFDEVRFTKATQHHADIRENKGPSLLKIHIKVPHHRSPYAMKFEDRSQEETEWQDLGAREAAWKLAKSVLKLKEK